MILEVEFENVLKKPLYRVATVLEIREKSGKIKNCWNGQGKFGEFEKES